jgi:prepilin-type N-terminal cleavage/methylation domain-containing protein
MRKTMKRSKSGYSLYEMIVVLAIVGILLTMSLPLIYKQLLLNNNETTALRLQAVFKTAQEEAMRRGAPLVVCSANYNGNNILTTNGCLGSTTDWSEGALAYIDLNSSTNYDSGERINAIRFADDVTVTTSVESFGFTSSGQLFDKTGAETWEFRLTQSRFGATVDTKLKLNNYGYFSSCTVGDQGC